MHISAETDPGAAAFTLKGWAWVPAASRSAVSRNRSQRRHVAARALRVRKIPLTYPCAAATVLVSHAGTVEKFQPSPGDRVTARRQRATALDTPVRAS